MTEETAFALLSYNEFPDFIPKPVAMARHGGSILIVTEMVDGMSLRDFIDCTASLSLEEKELQHSAVYIQLILYCWAKEFIFVEHFDLHSENIMIEYVT